MATTTNITNAPKTVNGVPNSIYNNADFADASADDKYLKKTGGVLSGSLTVPSLISNGSIRLQSSYPTLPTQTQLGGVFKTNTSTAMTDAMRWAFKTYATISLPAGCYIIFYSFELANNLATPPRPTINYGTISGGIGNGLNTWGNTDNFMPTFGRTINDGAVTNFANSTFFQHNDLTNRILYLNLLVGGEGLSTVAANITAVRVG